MLGVLRQRSSALPALGAVVEGLYGCAEREDWEEKYDQLPSHAAVSEDQGTDQAGQMKRQDKRAHIGRELIVSTETGFPDG